MTKLIWLAESPLTMIEGEEIAFSVEWVGAVNLSDPGTKVYKDGVDVSASVMLSGDSDEVSGNVQTMRRITALPGDGGSRYVVEVGANVDNNLEKRKLLIEIVRPGEEG
ncbi:MAG: hypothetical protein ABFS17_09635 [Chloroflexota bacterium]